MNPAIRICYIRPYISKPKYSADKKTCRTILICIMICNMFLKTNDQLICSRGNEYKITAQNKEETHLKIFKG